MSKKGFKKNDKCVRRGCKSVDKLNIKTDYVINHGFKVRIDASVLYETSAERLNIEENSLRICWTWYGSVILCSVGVYSVV